MSNLFHICISGYSVCLKLMMNYGTGHCNIVIVAESSISEELCFSVIVVNFVNERDILLNFNNILLPK